MARPTFVIIAGSSVMSAAPRNDPRIEPRPPTMIIARKTMLVLSVKRSQVMMLRWKAIIAPASPTKNDDVAKASSLVRKTSTPMTLAAMSWSRTASKARPMRLRIRLAAKSAVPAAVSTASQ